MNQVNLTECFSVSVTFAASRVRLNQFSALPRIPSHALCFLSLEVEIPQASCRGCCGSAYPPLSSSEFPIAKLRECSQDLLSLYLPGIGASHTCTGTRTLTGQTDAPAVGALCTKKERHLRLTRSQHTTTLQNKQSHHHSFCASIAAPVADFTEHPT